MTSAFVTAAKMILLGALSLSIGWGIRGNFGHEYGAMIPGALAAIAVVLASGREDWWRRVGYFGMFGALGWSFGGSISYMMVIAYTHSGHSESQLYGFACLAVIGFIWGALGGAGTALPACLDRERLTEMFVPILAVFAAWFLQDLSVPSLERALSGGVVRTGDDRHESPLYWFDTDWIAALLAILAVLLLALVRRRLCWGSRLILHLAIGWWLAFLLMVGLVRLAGIEFRMTPPRGDNWAGALGMTIAAFIFFGRERLWPVAQAALISGLIGGFGFAAATFLKLVEVRYVPMLLSQWFGEGTWQANWHSVLEQTYGFINGAGVAVAMYTLARRTPPVVDEPRVRRWTEAAAVGFVLLAITYVNMVKNVPQWIRLQAIPRALYGVPSRIWFDIGYAVLAVVVLGLLLRHLRRRIPLVPTSPLGQGQLLYLVFLWWIVIGDIMRAVPPFREQRLITEGVIFLNSVLCTLLVLIWPVPSKWPDRNAEGIYGWSVAGLGAAGLVALGLSVGGFWWEIRTIYGDTFAGHARRHMRFGPEARTGDPEKGKAHP